VINTAVRKQTVRLTVNGEAHEVEVYPNRMLVDTLRYDLGLTGTKEGCSIGVCGACTVLMNGKMVSSCITLTVMAEGAQLLTIEGLAKGDQLDPLQKAFIEKGGFQCGICTPGQIMAARALLNEIQAPSVEQIKEWMTGNLCRCTGYYKIIESIVAAAEEEQQLKAAR
jgi:carbon-monoxide dehydrogenase small subunit